MTRHLLLVLLLSLSTLVRAQESAPPDLSAEGMTRRFADVLRAPLERVLGEELGRPVAIAVVGSQALTDLLARENALMFKHIFPGAQSALLARTMAEQLAPAILGKLDEEHDRVLIQPSAFRTLSALTRTPELMTQETLDVILVHEVVHVFQSRRFGGVLKWFGEPQDMDELRLKMAVLEGHAQWVAREVAEATGRKAGFTAFHSLHTKEPEFLEESQRVQARTMRDLVGFPYVAGERMFAAVVAELKTPREAARRLFAHPPTTLRQVSHPEEYLHPVVSQAPDLAALAARLQPRTFPADAFQTQVVNVPEVALRGQLSPFLSAAVVEEAFAHYRSSRILVGGSKRHFGGQRMIALFGFETEEGAQAFTRAQRQLLAAKDERLKGQGQLQIAEATYVDCPLLGVEGVGYDKLIVANGVQKVRVRGALLRLGRVSVEVLSNNLPGEEMPDVWALARQVVAVTGGGISSEDEERLRADMSALLFAAELFRLERGRWPRRLRELRRLVRAPRDPWGGEYRLELREEEAPRVLSLGPDQKEGGVDLGSEAVLRR